jgi:enterochelin esterase-like enzyme
MKRNTPKGQGRHWNQWRKQLARLSLVCAATAPAHSAEPMPQVSTGHLLRWESVTGEGLSPRHVDIWLPPGFDAAQRYPVLYMHDGQMLFDARTTWNKQEWGVDQVLGKLIAEGEVPPVIVVGVWNSGPAGRHADYLPEKPLARLPKEVFEAQLEAAVNDERAASVRRGLRSDAYLRFLVEELKPRVDRELPTRPERDCTFIAGSSMGGLISFYALCEYPGVFGGAACLSTHWLGSFATADNPLPETFVDYAREHLPKPGQHRLYFDFGTETLDAHYEPHQRAIDAVLREKGFSEKHWQTQKFPGAAHDETSWQKRLHIPMRFLLKPLQKD